jgi:hypothetical protein
MELETIQELLDDAMEMAQGGEELPPGIDVESIDAVAQILSAWILKMNDDEEVETTIGDLASLAVACGYIAGRLESMQDVKQIGVEAGETLSYDIQPTHPEGQHVTINFNFR